MVKDKKIALIGNPNSGKTALFNLLTGLNQKVSNYPGITVEKKTGIAKISDSQNVEFIDLPGTYSIIPSSLDEKLVTLQIQNWMKGDNKPDIILSVVDATNLSRNLFLTSQLLDLGIPVIIALNMMDLVEDKEFINIDILKKQFNAAEVIPISALKKTGIKRLKLSLEKAISDPIINNSSFPDNLFPFQDKLNEIELLLENCNYQSE